MTKSERSVIGKLIARSSYQVKEVIIDHWHLAEYFLFSSAQTHSSALGIPSVMISMYTLKLTKLL